MKNALLLRQTAVTTDIGIALELLAPKLRLYFRNKAILASVYDEIRSIKQESLDHQLDIRFYALEYVSSASASGHDSSSAEKVKEAGQAAKPFFDKHEATRAAALHFFTDPQALLENRIGKFSTSQT